MVLTRAKSKQNLQDSGSAPQSAATSTSVAGKSQQQQQDQSTMNGQQHLNGNNVAHRSSPAKQAKTNGTPAAPTSQQGDTSFADYVAAPKTTSFEFMGPPGAFAISTLVPYFTYFFALGCDERGCPSTPFIPYMQDGLRQATTLDFWISLWDNEATLAYLAWYAWCIVCWAVLPGQWLEGGKLRNGEKLWYKINALQTFFASMLATGLVYYLQGAGPFLFVYDHWIGLVTASLVMSLVQATYCYAVSFIPGTMLAEGGNTGNVLYDWFIGRVLNPRIGLFDIKTFNELRPGLILWLICDIAMAVKQHNDIGRITDSMILVLIFQGVYVFDAMYNEAGILTQMDITTDGFGFMLAVGDLTWVTFTYGLQTRFLALYPKDLGYFWTATIVAINLLGYYIFRVSNEEKNSFRNGKNPKNLTYMKTERGTNLLTSGWWGKSRHPNYLGDWIMAWAWCLPTGFDTPLTYYYVVYFAILLIHRQLRDDEACHMKYGRDWEKYCKLVRWRIVPGLY